jgi:hypothetical protein
MTDLNQCVCNIFDIVATGGMVAGATAFEESTAVTVLGGIKASGTSYVSTNYVYDGMEAFWLLNDEYSGVANEVTDFTRNQLHGTAGENDQSPLTDTGIGCMLAQMFTGEQFISIPKDNAEAFTIFLTVKLDNEYPNQRVWFSRGNSDDGQVVLEIGQSAVQDRALATLHFDGTTAYAFSDPLEQLRWYRIAVSWQPGGSLKIYRNGVLEGEDTTTGVPYSLTNGGSIGRTDNGSSFEGSIQDIRFFRDVKSDAWIAADWASLCDLSWAELV